MRTVQKWAASILPLAILVTLTSCVTYTVTDTSVGSMSYEEAYSIAKTTFKTAYNNITDVKIASNHITLFLTNGQKYHEIRNLDQITDIKVDGPTEDIVVTEGTTQYRFHVAGPHAGTKAGRIKLVKAIYVISQREKRNGASLREYFENFERSLSAYRDKIAANTELPEEAYKYKVQAEGAIREKDFVNASNYFDNAISAAPWWPHGYYNRALVVGELGHYKLAMRLMKCYLQLAPDAPNARLAQNKIYDWERADSL